ncbi:protein-tyrosine phosphatase [Aphelenchoides avenae]|nr:protein-tyrosine phosphatase [Aphelenchus avenae]
MCWEQGVQIVIMLSRLVEKNINKCHQYYPTKKMNELDAGAFTCRLKKEEEVTKHYVLREIELSVADPNFEVEDGGERSRTIYLFQFTTWPDFGVPEHTDHFLEFLQHVRKLDVSLTEASGPHPIVCHCSAGIGRSGTFVVVDTVLSKLEKEDRNGTAELNGAEKVEATGEIPSSEREPRSVDDLVVLMRDHRMGLIQTPQQLRFSWKAIVDWIEKTDPKALTSSSRKRSSDAAETAAEAKQKRKETVEKMKEKMQRFERLRDRKDWWKRKLFVGSAIAVGVISVGYYYLYLQPSK